MDPDLWSSSTVYLGLAQVWVRSCGIWMWLLIALFVVRETRPTLVRREGGRAGTWAERPPTKNLHLTLDDNSETQSRHFEAGGWHLERKKKEISVSSSLKIGIVCLGLPWWLSGKEYACQCRRHRFDTWVKKIPWRKKQQPTPVFSPGESHGQGSQVGCSLQHHKNAGHDLAT